MTLSEGQITALRNLARKRAGESVDWIRISEARALTDLGLAVRSREGWDITAEGVRALEALDPETLPWAAQPTPLRPDEG